MRFTIKQNLSFILWSTIIGLSIVFSTTYIGFRNIQEHTDTVERRLTYMIDLTEIKASAISTILLDPKAQDTLDIFSSAHQSIDNLREKTIASIKREEIRNEVRNILSEWDNYYTNSIALIEKAKTAGRDHERFLSKFRRFDLQIEL